ncbi:MAG TPA: hypothetical protein VG962_02445 [Steroidobacteraceae bacterium]|nr:hypothetical protein [Steroidobacteraceae bacterium]
MEYIAPLIQTVLWVGLIAWIVWRFFSPIYGLLTALQKRIETGSTVKAGPFELVDQLRPQAPEQQKQKIEQELLEEQPNLATELPIERIESSMSLKRGARQARLFQTEDLALRAIQAEYGQPISRQLTGGADLGFDGVFIFAGRLNIVEVKYLRDKSSIPKLRESLERIVRTILGYNWQNAQLIVAVVFEREEDVPKSDVLLLNSLKGLDIPITIRPFSLPELQRRFGIEVTEGG